MGAAIIKPMDEDYEEYLDAIIDNRRTYCDLCNKHASDNCQHPKNGYCQQFRLQAEKDAKEFNVHQSINQQS